MSKVLIIGHRGAAGHTENTIPAFESALEQGAKAIEMDVRQTGDDLLVVAHPSVINDCSVQSSRYEEFKNLGDGSEVPLLETVLHKFGKKTFLNIEFKQEGFEEQAVALIAKYCNPEKTMVSAFSTNTLIKVHELLPGIQLGYIYNRTQDEAARHNCPVDVVIPQFRLASRELIEEVHDEGLQVWAWTVNEDEEIKRLVRLGVDGLITDFPGRVKAILG